ncbi:GNAT family N-acetyltransferase [Rhodobacteraceae bacterium RKSG542]|uniref:GNAT family N-acetyltransferase n=1 Tax=Pseudovibrio flavus TaxID=2529854 RepID=UPI0012BCE428|nr:GNAT family N-acetyltransferase [Pseudovibrio flavus]MTI18404.1 GNAT family N-acetyltransferase [Pseudovibrio flavus]
MARVLVLSLGALWFIVGPKPLTRNTLEREGRCMTFPIYRRASEADLPAVVRLEEHYMRELEPKNLAQWCASEAAVHGLLASNQVRMFVSQLGGEIVGYGYWGLKKETPHIYNLYVYPDYRRYGIAKDLLERVEADIVKAGFSRCTYCPVSTHPARTFIEQAGFELMRDDGERLHMVRELG